MIDMSPTASLKPCSYPGCANLVRSGRCAKHQIEQNKSEFQQYRDPNIQKLYDRRWREVRLKYLASHPWCEECLRANIYEPATDVHHVQRHGGEPSIFRSSPLMALCHRCHSRITANEVGIIHQSVPTMPRGGKNVL